MRSVLALHVALVGFAAGCFYSSGSRPSQAASQPAPGQPTVEDPAPTQPAPFEQAPTMLSSVGPPTTTNTASAVAPVTVSAWSLYKTATGCATAIKAPCTPPPCPRPQPQPYECLVGVALPATIVSDGDLCALDCPQPPCRAVPCPTL